jgi:hypothetical protein
MQVASSLTPWPWPSRFSNVEHTEVKIPPVLVSKPKGKTKICLAFPGPHILFIHSSNQIYRMKVKIAANLFVLNLSVEINLH